MLIMLSAITIYIQAAHAYNHNYNALAYEKGYIRYYVMGDVIYKGDVDPENMFELDIGELDTRDTRNIYSYTIRFYKYDGEWYFRILHGAEYPIRGTVYEYIFNFCRSRYY